MGKALRADGGEGRSGWGAFARRLIAVALAALSMLTLPGVTSGQTPVELTTAGVRLQAGRFTVVAFPKDARLAQSILTAAQRSDTFPGLPRPERSVLIAIAPDQARFRQWVGTGAPEWGAAIAFPEQQRIVMQGAAAASDAGDPLVVLRHELAHLALHEFMGSLPSRWFDEGYASVAAGEWSREAAFETSLSLIWRTLPGVDSLDAGFYSGSSRAQWSYAIAHRVVAEMSGIDTQRGLTNFLGYWRRSGSFERALRDAYGMTGEQFDRFWKQRTRRRYGALALVTNVSAFIGLLAILLVPLVVKRRRRDRNRLEAMRKFEAEQERLAQVSMLAKFEDGAGTDQQPTGPNDPATSNGSVPS